MMMGGAGASGWSASTTSSTWRSTDWVSRAEELAHRLLVIHSVDDEFVPVRALASSWPAARPDLVTLRAVARPRGIPRSGTPTPSGGNASVAAFAAG